MMKFIKEPALLKYSRCMSRAKEFTITVLIFLVIASSSNVFAMPETITFCWKKYREASNDSSRIVLLSRLGFYYQDYLMDSKTADSLSCAAILLACKSNNSQLILHALNAYAENNDPDLLWQKAFDFSNQAYSLGRSCKSRYWQWRSIKNMSMVCLAGKEFSRAAVYGKAALAIARTSKADSLIAASYLLVGKCYEVRYMFIESLQNYLTAYYLAERTGDLETMKKADGLLSLFFYATGLLDDALQYREKEKAIILQQQPVDSNALMWVQYNIHVINAHQPGTVFNEHQVRDVIGFAMRHSNERLKNWEFAVYRTYLLKENDITSLYNLYNNIFPDEFRLIYLNDRELYYRLHGYFMEFLGKADSATLMFEKTEAMIRESSLKGRIYQANFYNRFGQFLIRQGRNREAIQKVLTAIQLAHRDENIVKYDYVLVSDQNLVTLYQGLGDYKSALHYASDINEINRKIQVISNKAQVKTETLNRKQHQLELAAEKDRLSIKQGETQRNVLIGGLVLMLVLLYSIYRNYASQKKLNRLLDAEKRKSDDLLLNILPFETAEELKEKGSAEAKAFDEVTVMFTDFKDFTQTSEKMEAADLVKKIHYYFSEFDRIIARYPIEKIKIIGDSYMCVGGLPVTNATHAYDVVSAALELQSFVERYKLELKERGEPYFEVRIGIHTGPVVAGIVGLNKFAYDIWGDTVNTASRMESASETGKVNISGRSYEKIKDRFNCTYRGRINVKNKGEIDMYFVDSPVTS